MIVLLPKRPHTQVRQKDGSPGIVLQNRHAIQDERAIDEEAFRIWLQRFVQNKIGVYLGSGGGGESHALTWPELQRIYEIGVEECKGKIPVYANPPEQYTARQRANTSLRRSNPASTSSASTVWRRVTA